MAIVAIALVALFVEGRMEVMRLSGTAAVLVVSSEVRVGSSYDQSPAGSTIRYTYVVNGATYLGIDFRRWLNVDCARTEGVLRSRRSSEASARRRHLHLR